MEEKIKGDGETKLNDLKNKIYTTEDGYWP